MDRRTFLLNSAALAVGSTVADLNGMAQSEHPMAPPVPSHSSVENLQPFTWEAEGLVFSFEFLGNRLRFRSMLPQGVSGPHGLPPSTEISGLETFSAPEKTSPTTTAQAN